MSNFSTLSEMLLARRSSDHRVHFIDGDDDHRSITFAELVEGALACLKSFQERGFSAG
ncbi:MAG: hypothetical protein HKN35_04790, partial [Woeseia sp.]|nr:hypothetical protein [Woeseia sp.]